MPGFSLLIISLLTALFPARAATLPAEDLRLYLSNAYESNVSLNHAYIEASRHVHQLNFWAQQNPEHHRLQPLLERAIQHRNALEARLSAQLLNPMTLTKVEFIELFNLISDDCKAGISGDHVILDQKLPDGSHHLAELPLDSATLKHTPRADIGPHDVTRYNDPSEFSLVGRSQDARLRPYNQSITLHFKIGKRIDNDRYQLAPDGMIVNGFTNNTGLFWKTEDTAVLTCRHKSEIQF